MIMATRSEETPRLPGPRHACWRIERPAQFGVSSDRVAMIIAVLEKRAELRLAAEDVFVNIAGGSKSPSRPSISPSPWPSPRPI